MPTSDPIVAAYIKRLITIPDYAEREGISVVQAHRRIDAGKVDTEQIGKRKFVVLDEDAATREPHGPPPA